MVVILTMAEAETDTVKPMALVRVDAPLQLESRAPALPHTAFVLMSEVCSSIHQLLFFFCMLPFSAIVQLAKPPGPQCVKDTEVQGEMQHMLMQHTHLVTFTHLVWNT